MAAKPEWGTKQTCPKCGERFYDLGKASPVVCIACETSWTPEPVLKSKQPMAAPAAPAPAAKKPKDDAGGETTDEDDIVDAAKNADDEKDDSVGDISLDDDSTDMAEVVDAKLDTGGDA